MTAERVSFHMSVASVAVLVAFVARHHDDRTSGSEVAHGLKEAHCTHHVHREGRGGLCVGCANQGLRREMDYHLRLATRDGFSNRSAFPDIAALIRGKRQ